MLTRLAGFIVVAAALALPSAASACSCGRTDNDLPTELRRARADSGAIYRARISSVDARTFGGKASVRVLEVFKGPVKVGDTLEVPAGGGGDCTIGFRAGREYLMYAHAKPSSVSLCSRTRPVSEGDSELVWLRTGRLPPVPVALQREVVSCEPCDTEKVGGRLIAAPGDAPGRSVWPYDAELQMKAGRPFFTLSHSASDPERQVMFGVSFEGRPFELAQTWQDSTVGVCMEKVHLRWCKRLDVSTPAPGRSPRFECVEPGEATLQCDASRSRKASREPLEALPSKQCDWRSPDAFECELGATARTLAKGAPRSPLMVCQPRYGGGRAGHHLCRVEVKPPSTDKAR